MQTLSIQPVSPVMPSPAEVTPRAPRPQGPAPVHWAEPASHPFVETVRASRTDFALRQPASANPHAYLVEENGWVMGDAVEQSVSRWLIVIGGSIAAAATGALLGGLLSM